VIKDHQPDVQVPYALEAGPANSEPEPRKSGGYIQSERDRTNAIDLEVEQHRYRFGLTSHLACGQKTSDRMSVLFEYGLPLVQISEPFLLHGNALESCQAARGPVNDLTARGVGSCADVVCQDISQDAGKERQYPRDDACD
jgi:hypothetical protein